MRRWLQWSTIDLEHGHGGVEAHARCVAHELKIHHQIETVFSRDPRALFSDQFDVIQTHGSSIPTFLELNARVKNRGPLWVQTLHGLSFERMWACNEWAWLGGYQASARELAAILQSDVIVAVHDQLSLYPVIKKLKRHVAVCSNGWNSFELSPGSSASALIREPAPLFEPRLSEEVRYKLEGADPFWIFIGRGDDPVKNVGLVKEAWTALPQINLICVPGTGFEEVNWALRLGALNPSQVRLVLERARGLVITSRYEGLPLVVLEALALGTPVVAPRVGGLRTLSPRLEGLALVESIDAEKITAAVGTMMNLDVTGAGRAKRASTNRGELHSWREVTSRIYNTVALAQHEKNNGNAHARGAP